MSAATINFDNLLTESKYAFHAGDTSRAAAFLRSALSLIEQQKAQDTPRASTTTVL